MLKRLWFQLYGVYGYRVYHGTCKFVAHHLIPRQVRYYVLINAAAKARLDFPSQEFIAFIKSA